LTDVRFKLLAFVPTISGAAIAVVSHRPSAPELLAIGLLGLIATSGVIVYELRNTQIYDYALERAQVIETRLGIVSIFDPATAAGLYGERPAAELRVFGVGRVQYDRALALVYGAAFAGWSYVVAWGALRAANVAAAQKIGGVVGAIAGVLVVFELLRVAARPAKPGS
jgi:hypothetical protein